MNTTRYETIKKMRSENKTLREIGEVFGISRARVEQILNKRKPIEAGQRLHILAINGFMCPICESKFGKGNKPEFHHIDSNPSNNENYNLICLCHSCHIKVGIADRELRNAYKQVHLTCKECKEVRTVRAGKYRPQFCSEICKKAWWIKNGKTNSPEKRRAYQRVRIREYYRRLRTEQPEKYKAMVKKANHKYYYKDVEASRAYQRMMHRKRNNVKPEDFRKP